jgi:CxxC motif-containing protein (DUF1111 family)
MPNNLLLPCRILDMKKYVFIFVGLCVTIALSCRKLQPAAPADNEVLDGMVDGLSADQKMSFLRGDRAFNNEIFTRETGLGPLFVAASCGACHAGDGKGHPFTTLTRFGQTDSTGNKFLAMGAPQLQDRAIPGHQPEQVPAGATFSKFLPPANTGMGFLEAVPDATLLAMADPNDADGDGISGVVNWVELKEYVQPTEGSILRGGKCTGRFGKKAGAHDLLQQTAGAYNQDMGITSAYEPHDTYTGQSIAPEVSEQTILDVVFYLRTLKAPVQRNAADANVIKGKDLFLNAGCGKCHTPALTTGNSQIAPLANVKIYPYTDMLLHDMGPGLDDGYTEGTATTAEWRTPALWGLGLSKNSQGGKYFLLHDGRAHSITEAILLHGGEATKSRNNFESLTETDKALMLKFLESL